MRTRLLIGLGTALVLALSATTARAATQVRQVQFEIPGPFMTPNAPGGTLTLDFVFQNKRSDKRKFTPRRLTRIDFSQVRLSCMNAAGNGTTTLLLTSTMQTAVKVVKAPQPAGKKPKPNRYAFRLSYSFPTFTGTLAATIDKPNHGPRKLRSQGSLNIVDLDSDPNRRDCSTQGPKQWGGLPVTLVH